MANKGTRTSAEKFAKPQSSTKATVNNVNAGRTPVISSPSVMTNPISNPVTNVQTSQPTSLSNAITEAARNALVSTAQNANSKAAYSEVPNMGASYGSVVNPATVVPSSEINSIGATNYTSPTLSRANPPSLNDAIANAARNALATMTDAEKNGAGSLFNQILNREQAAQTLFPISTDKTTSGANASTKYDGTPATNGGKSTNYTYNSSRTSGLPASSGSYGIFDTDSLYALLNSRLQEYENNYNTLMQNLLNQYNSNSASIESEYANALKALGDNLSDTENLLRSQYDTSQNTLEEQRRRALQEAYIQRMMEQKSLSDTLADYGLSGGATESVLSNLLNNYRGNRNTIENNATVSLRDLLEKYNSNVASARERYNTSLQQAQNNRLNAMRGLADSLAAAQANAENARTQARAGAYDDLYNTLANLYLRSM